MKAIRLYLDEAAERGIVKNDNDIAERLGLNRSAVSQWRSGKTAPNEDQAARLAALLGKPEIMAECMAHRAKVPEARAMWERAARTLSMAASLIAAVAVSFFLTPSPANASNGAGLNCTTLYYVKLMRRAMKFASRLAAALLPRPA